MKKTFLLNLITTAALLNAGAAFGVTAYDAAILGDGPTSYWPMQETTGPSVHDVVSTNNGAMYVGTHQAYAGKYDVWVPNDGSAFGLGGPGFLYGVPDDKAIYFTNATGTFIEIPYSASFDQPKFTAEAWFRFPDWASVTPVPTTVDMGALSCDYNAGSQRGWLFYLTDGASGTTGGDLAAWLGKGGGWTQADPYVGHNDQWIHAVMTYDGTNLFFYTNGVLAKKVAGGYSSPGNALTKPPLRMGALSESGVSLVGRTYQGGMSHVALYPTALADTQIAYHYYIATHPAEPPSILTQPVGGTNYVGYSRTLSVTAVGSTPLYYQWYQDSVAIAGATNPTLVRAVLDLTNAGSYTVTITNSMGGTNSDAAMIGVLPLPSNPYQAAVISQVPQAYYPLNETDGTVANDIINADGNQATYDGFPTLGVPGASSYLGTAVALDGNIQGIYVNDKAVMNIVGKLTMEAWVQLQATNLEQIVVAHSPDQPGNPTKASDTLGIHWDGTNANYYVESYQQSFGTPQGITNGTTYPVPAEDVGNWVYLVGVADGTAWHLYRNGVEVAYSPDTNGAVSANGGWAIGANSSIWTKPPTVTAPLFWGPIQDVGIYSYALWPERVQQHYQLGLTGVYVPLTPKMTSFTYGGNMVVSWTSGYLQQAPALAGPWTYVPNATPPFLAGMTNTMQFFRATLKAP
jgi:hypothetical protein